MCVNLLAKFVLKSSLLIIYHSKGQMIFNFFEKISEFCFGTKLSGLHKTIYKLREADFDNFSSSYFFFHFLIRLIFSNIFFFARINSSQLFFLSVFLILVVSYDIFTHKLNFFGVYKLRACSAASWEREWIWVRI